jgi:hypothetical protein
MPQLRTNLIAYINKLLIKTLEFYPKCYISDIHWVSAGENRNPKPNPKTVGEKSNPNLKPLDPKPADIRPKPCPAAIFTQASAWHTLSPIIKKKGLGIKYEVMTDDKKNTQKQPTIVCL